MVLSIHLLVGAPIVGHEIGGLGALVVACLRREYEADSDWSTSYFMLSCVGFCHLYSCVWTVVWSDVVILEVELALGFSLDWGGSLVACPGLWWTPQIGGINFCF